MLAKFYVAVLAASLVVFSGGCGAKQETPSGGRQQQARSGTQRQAPRGANQGTAQGERLTPPDLMGEVSSVGPNGVTLKVAKMPTFQPGTATQTGQPRQPGERPALEFTGETKTIKIPAEVNVIAIARGGPSEPAVEIVVKELKPADVLQVWFSDQNKTVVSRAMLTRRQ